MRWNSRLARNYVSDHLYRIFSGDSYQGYGKSVFENDHVGVRKFLRLTPWTPSMGP